ncbi:MAG: 2-deoxy-5-keto-D-gluconate 6-phosphate aldolase domain-containing protein, partial [Waddliaceae bacterium]
APPLEVRHFKGLVYEGFRKTQETLPEASLGLIVDGQYGEEVLKQATKEGFFTARCIEEPNSSSLNFLENKEAESILRTWPKNTVVKVLCRLTADPLPIEKLVNLYAATKNTGHQLLIECTNAVDPNDLPSIKEAINLCYEATIFPAWWKLPPIEDDLFWSEIAKTIERCDPYCQGILLLGENRALEHLSTTFRRIRQQQPLVKGFAVGRSIWGAAAQDWLQGKKTDQEVIDDITKNFAKLIETSKYRKDTYDSHTRERTGKNPHSHHGASPYFVPDSTKSRTL